ncbi:helicase-associated (plasmid) [Pseudarthrobacter chlorophenolicus A6]|uniref:Helicase-associated n=1 Tax=Pseudarthrobacter chlorophenolicus (strain ATCC 700700 / DSM 12829 / CIP 107037 / JCM 12360 / KCTC 9906 / NCIMB 13794 / A6) TaxID=452863 RepID=B8HIL8_PSECP|nr:helicase associated domain-containing protein [Pseudarthrobacter chlorophenolicus]ACL42265.1 helicase-associated [Pseudarthrobacter chlorophenolicus A6]SDQ15660.1 Helicase associated domain-containing protein [Pseudarthrobacter chlorophenolicus]
MSPTTRRRTAAETLEELDRFQQAHGRLPKSNATDPAEKYLANFLFTTLRQKERRGTLKPELRERAAGIPGALKLDTHPDQDALLDELRDFIQVNGYAPRHSRKGVPAREVQLRAWVSNNLYLDPARKSPRLRARHEAISALLATAPSYAEKDLDDRIALAEEFVRENGYRPSSRAMSWLKDYVHGTYHLDGPFGTGSRLNDIRAARIKAILAYPSIVEYSWNRNFDQLKDYASRHDGALPGNWSHPLFSWLTVQRRQYRRGRLSPERVSTLRTLPGVLPEVQSLEQAA